VAIIGAYDSGSGVELQDTIDGFISLDQAKNYVKKHGKGQAMSISD